MREIKFRAWAKKENGVTHPANQMFSWNRFGFGNGTGLRFDWSVVISQPEIYELMQFTGLKDKNGVEIYEGDELCIVKDVVVDVIGGHERTEPEGKFFTVEWNNGGWFIGDEMLWEWVSDSEIIGNIYENPELLK